MDVYELAFTIVLFASLTVLLVHGEIFERTKIYIITIVPRRFEEPVATLMYCSQCLGVWIGIIGLLCIDFGRFISIPKYLLIVLFPAAVSTCAMILDRIIYGRNTEA